MTDTSAIPTDGGHWRHHAIGWELLGPPLRPSAEELAAVAAVVSGLMPRVGDRGLDALILGVTPEYARFPWPSRSNLIAMDRCEAMIRHVWPGSTADSERVLRGDWLAPEGGLGPFDLVLGDGVLSMLAYPGDYERFGRAIRGLTRPEGRWALRLFVRPSTPEDPEGVLADVRGGRLTNINEFKLRLGMALCEAGRAEDVGVAEIWRFWDEARRRDPSLGDRWPVELQSTIENYREGTARYSFPRLEPVLDILGRHATIREVRIPGYRLGDCCPLVVLEA